MVLTSAVALARGGELEWRHVETARPCRSAPVRALSSPTISMPNGPRSAICVGVFRLEGRGVQLFDRIDGDHFTILGMPLLPLLGALRERGLMAA